MAMLVLFLLFSVLSCVYSCSLNEFYVTVTEPNCYSTTIKIKGCYGHCSSSSILSVNGQTSPENLDMSCCASVKYTDIDVYLICSDGSRSKSVKSAEQCSCQGCHVR